MYSYWPTGLFYTVFGMQWPARKLAFKSTVFYKSNNAPQPRDILCTMMLSILAGHNRFCNMEQIYGDAVSAQVLKIKENLQ